MSKNTAKIRDGLKQLAYRPYEIMSGVVVENSLDESAYTISVLPTGSETAIVGVVLNTVADEDKGMLLIPKDGSHVVIGCIDGPGEWILLRAGEITKATFKINNVQYEINGAGVSIVNAGLTFNAGSEVFKMNTSTESLYEFLRDLVTATKSITVGTSGGPSTTPVNEPEFLSLLSRLENLLSA
jgi:hypothetical protein